MSDIVLHDPMTYADGFPHEYFRELRASDPVSHHQHPYWERGYWVIASHDEVQRVSRDSAGFRNHPHPFLVDQPDDEMAGMSSLLISLDAPEHSQLRKLISRGFTPRRVADLTDRIHARVDAIFDFARRSSVVRPGHRRRSVASAAWIADLVGVPEADRKQVFEWTELTFGFDPTVTMEQRGEAAMMMYGYADQLCEQRRVEPRDDLLSVLLDAEVDGERLTQMQIDLFFLLLQNAGSETTRNLITTGTLALLERPDQLQRLRDDMSLLPVAIEELLRYVSPVMHFTRHAIVDTEVGGRAIAAGDRVVLAYASANRDEHVFRAPDDVDVARQPNDHVAFGAGGPHYCLGASLARLEAKVMFEAILTRFDGLEIDGSVAGFPRVYSNLIDGFAHLPIRWSNLR